MKALAPLATALLFGCPGAAMAQTAAFPVVQSEAGFLDSCEQDWVAREPASAPWARNDCQVKWNWATASGPLADAILTLSLAEGESARTPEEARDLLAKPFLPAGVSGYLTATGIRFDWQEPGSEGRFNVTGALRSRGVALQALGCPTYPGASMGREKVMLATLPGRKPFVLTVYSRGAPTGSEPGVYEVNADFSGAVPDMSALQAGLYPGGGGRAFAVDPTGWTSDCPDPE